MHNYFIKSKQQQIILVILFVLECLGQRRAPSSRQPVEVAKCAEYEEKIFEASRTFSFFMIGAPSIAIKENKCDKYEPFIVDGDPARAKEFPHAARLGISAPNRITDWVCGGALISEKFVLTAAHCFYSQNGKINVVRLGDLIFDNDNDDADPEDIPVKRIIEHPNYKDTSNYDDIGLLELERPVRMNGYKHPTCLPVGKGDEIKDLIAIGWGSERFASDNSKKLLKVRLERFSYDYCQNYARKSELEELEFGIKDESQLCAGSYTSTKDTCQGDSGGPLLAYHEKYPCMYTIIGVTSFGIDGGCGNPGAPGVYTRVYNYMDWIKQYVWP